MVRPGCQETLCARHLSRESCRSRLPEESLYYPWQSGSAPFALRRFRILQHHGVCPRGQSRYTMSATRLHGRGTVNAAPRCSMKSASRIPAASRGRLTGTGTGNSRPITLRDIAVRVPIIDIAGYSWRAVALSVGGSLPVYYLADVTDGIVVGLAEDRAYRRRVPLAFSSSTVAGSPVTSAP